ncbi:MAG: cytochrome c [Cytophagales bacterium]|nr:cytochrome c [Cytophagales bacterium]
MKKLLLIVAALATTTFSVTSHAQFAKPDDAAKYRQGALTVMAAHFGRVGAMVQGKVPFDAKAAQENIDIAVAMSKLPWAGFGPSGEGATLKNAAKPEIWKEQAKFKDLSEKSQAELIKVQTAAKTGSLDAIKAAFGAAGASCKSCHDAFRI